VGDETVFLCSCNLRLCHCFCPFLLRARPAQPFPDCIQQVQVPGLFSTEGNTSSVPARKTTRTGIAAIVLALGRGRVWQRPQKFSPPATTSSPSSRTRSFRLFVSASAQAARARGGGFRPHPPRRHHRKFHRNHPNKAREQVRGRGDGHDAHPGNTPEGLDPDA
jgi:hypothetical protein